MSSIKAFDDMFSGLHGAKDRGLITNIIHTHIGANSICHFGITFAPEVCLEAIKTLQRYLGTHYPIPPSAHLWISEGGSPVLVVAVPKIYLSPAIQSAYITNKPPPPSMPFI